MKSIYIKLLFRDFLICGVIGWCMEIIFTSLGSLLIGNFTLKAHTSLWMFPIYGLAMFIFPLYQKIAFFPIWLRASLYAVLIFFVEFTSGLLLKAFQLCPWNYEHSRFHIHGLIRLDYAPLWFFTGLLFERLLRSDASNPPGIKNAPALQCGGK